MMTEMLLLPRMLEAHDDDALLKCGMVSRRGRMNDNDDDDDNDIDNHDNIQLGEEVD